MVVRIREFRTWKTLRSYLAQPHHFTNKGTQKDYKICPKPELGTEPQLWPEVRPDIFSRGSYCFLEDLRIYLHYPPLLISIYDKNNRRTFIYNIIRFTSKEQQCHSCLADSIALVPYPTPRKKKISVRVDCIPTCSLKALWRFFKAFWSKTKMGLS